MRFHEIVIHEIQRARSLKIFKFFAERIGEPRQAAAVHPQRVILLFNVASGNPRHVRHQIHSFPNSAGGSSALASGGSNSTTPKVFGAGRVKYSPFRTKEPM